MVIVVVVVIIVVIVIVIVIIVLVLVDYRIQENYFLLGFLKGEFDGTVGCIHVCHVVYQFLFGVWPDHKDIIDKSSVVGWFVWAII